MATGGGRTPGPGAGQVDAGGVEEAVVARDLSEQRQLSPVGIRPPGRRGRRLARGAPPSAAPPRGGCRSVAVVHAHEEQLMVPDRVEARPHIGLRGQLVDSGLGPQPGLAPAQTTEIPLQRLDTAAACADGRRVAAAEHVAGRTEPSAEGAPGQAAVAGVGGLVVGLRIPAHAGGSDRPSRRLGTTAGTGAAAPTAVRLMFSSPGRVTFCGSGINRSPISQPSTTQMTSRSSSLRETGWPDHGAV